MNFSYHITHDTIRLPSVLLFISEDAFARDTSLTLYEKSNLTLASDMEGDGSRMQNDYHQRANGFLLQALELDEKSRTHSGRSEKYRERIFYSSCRQSRNGDTAVQTSYSRIRESSESEH